MREAIRKLTYQEKQRLNAIIYKLKEIAYRYDTKDYLTMFTDGDCGTDSEYFSIHNSKHVDWSYFKNNDIKELEVKGFMKQVRDFMYDNSIASLTISIFKGRVNIEATEEVRVYSYFLDKKEKLV